MAKKRTQPTPISALIASVLEGRGHGQGGALMKLQAGWKGAVGEKIASHASPAMLKGGRLTVTVDGSAWMNQLQLLSVGIIEKVNAALGDETVHDVAFRLGRPEPAGGRPRKEPPFRPVRRRLDSSESAEIDRAVSAIADESIRGSARRLMESAYSRKK